MSSLAAEGVSDWDIIAITGHRNAQSLASYSRPSGKQQQSTASALDSIGEPLAPLLPAFPDLTASDIDNIFSNLPPAAPSATSALCLPGPGDYSEIDNLLSSCTADDIRSLEVPAKMQASSMSSINFVGANMAGAHFTINITK